MYIQFMEINKVAFNTISFSQHFKNIKSSPIKVTQAQGQTQNSRSVKWQHYLGNIQNRLHKLNLV